MGSEQKKDHHKNLGSVFKKMMGVKKFYGGQKIFRGATNFYGHKKNKKMSDEKKKGHQKNFANTFKTEVMASKNGSI